jgi:four helix bundle protein
MAENNRKFDLEERTAKFGESVIDLMRTIKQDAINRPLISQIIRSSTSIGANYMEADAGVSKKDFRNKIGTCKKEAKETKHWLRMISKANPQQVEECRVIWKEAHELVLIFSKIYNNSKDKD